MADAEQERRVEQAAEDLHDALKIPKDRARELILRAVRKYSPPVLEGSLDPETLVRPA